MGIKKSQELNRNLTALKTVKFDIRYIYNEHKSFNKFARNGIFLNSDYSDMVWIYSNKLEVRKIYYDIINDICISSIYSMKGGINNLVDALKAFVLNKLDYHSIDGIINFLVGFKSIIEITEYFEEYTLDNVDVHNCFTTKQLLDLLIDFIEYYPEMCISSKFRSYFIEYQGNIKWKEFSQYRSLPTINTFIKFDEFVDYYFNEQENENTQKYFFVYLWWRITMIIPLRATEFIATPYNCIRAENSKYFMKIRRTLLKAGSKMKHTHSLNDYKVEEIQIDHSLYLLIKNYKDNNVEIMDNSNQDEDFLLSYKYYSKYFRVNNNNILRIVTYTRFKAILEGFFKNIVDKSEFSVVNVEDNKLISLEDSYIERIRIYDTRHYSIISMILQGINPLKVMELAGHTNLESTYGYYNHLPTFIKSWTYNFARKNNNNVKNHDLLELAKQLSESQNQLKSEPEYRRSVNNHNGLCDKRDYISTCIKYHCNCQLCPSYTSLNDEIDLDSKLSKSIESEIEVIKYILTGKYGVSQKFELYRQAINRIQTYSNQKIIICKRRI